MFFRKIAGAHVIGYRDRFDNWVTVHGPFATLDEAIAFFRAEYADSGQSS